MNQSATIHPVILAVPDTFEALSRRDRVKALGKHARYALHLSAEYSGHVLGELEKDELGAPVPQKNLYWSITHKERFVAGVSAPYRIGIDIEQKKEVKPALFTRIADDAEWTLAGGKTQEAFFRFWTAKEAVLKAIGRGMTALSECRIEEIDNDALMRLSVSGVPWSVVHYRAAYDHLVALTTRGETIVWHQPAGKDITCT